MSAAAVTRWFSLRRRLLATLLSGLAVAWLFAAAMTWRAAHHEIDELFDAQLAQAAQTLLTQAEAVRLDRPGNGADQGRVDLLDAEEIAHRYQHNVLGQIWRGDGRLLLRSRDAPAVPLTPRDGFSEVDGGAGHWRYFSRWNAAHGLQVQVAEDHRVRDRQVLRITASLMLPALGGLLLIAGWAWLATHRGLAVLAEIARQIAARAPQQLQALVPPQAPEELRPMLAALNDLFRRVDSALDAERRFTADAAHELRTPLAALQAQAQVALRARDDDERQASLQQLQGGLRRASRLVEQMLALARLDPERRPPSWPRVAFAPVVAAACADVGTLIFARNLDFRLDADPDAQVAGQTDWLHLLVRNLVDNAARHAPPGGRVEVTVRAGAQAVRLGVDDDGPGIPAAERDSVLHRFHRLVPANGQGSGLGLSIVARIAELHGAVLTLGDSPLGGLRVCVDFPRADATQA